MSPLLTQIKSLHDRIDRVTHAAFLRCNELWLMNNTARKNSRIAEDALASMNRWLAATSYLSATAPEEAKGRPDAAEQLAPERLATA